MVFIRNDKDIQSKLDLSDDDLLVYIGTNLQAPQAFPSSPQELMTRAKKWLKVQIPKIQGSVCNNTQIEEFGNGDNINADVIAALASVVSTLCLPVDPVALSVLLARRGLKSLCADIWSKR
jgi:hypothetical protein